MFKIAADFYTFVFFFQLMIHHFQNLDKRETFKKESEQAQVLLSKLPGVFNFCILRSFMFFSSPILILQRLLKSSSESWLGLLTRSLSTLNILLSMYFFPAPLLSLTPLKVFIFITILTLSLS